MEEAGRKKQAHHDSHAHTKNFPIMKRNFAWWNPRVLRLALSILCWLAWDSFALLQSVESSFLPSQRRPTHTHRPKGIQTTSLNGIVEEELLEGEVTLQQRDKKPITTLTWFQGDAEQAAVVLKDRLHRILQSNPWLTGRVIPKSRNNHPFKKKLYLVFDDDLDSPKLDSSQFWQQVTPSQSRIHRRTRLDQLATACPNAVFLSNGPNQPLLQVSLIPCRCDPQSRCRGSFAYYC